MTPARPLIASLLLVFALPACSSTQPEPQNEFPAPIAQADIIGNVTTPTGAPLPEILVVVEYPFAASAYYSRSGASTNVVGAYTLRIQVYSGGTLPRGDTTSVFVVFVAGPPRYTGPRDSILIPVRFAPFGQPIPVTRLDRVVSTTPAP